MPTQTPTPTGPATKSLKELASSKLESGNPTMLGDPISLKAESSDSEPPNPTSAAPSGASASQGANQGAKQSAKNQEGKGKGGKEQAKGKGNKEEKSLSQAAKDTNPSLLGDPISLKAESSDSEPPNPTSAADGKEKKKRSSKL